MSIKRRRITLGISALLAVAAALVVGGLPANAAAVHGFSSAATAAPTDHRAPTTTSARVEAATAAPELRALGSGSKCGATRGWGKIRYQACFNWYCSSTCDTWGYLGIINTATSSRTVNWDLDFKSPWYEQHDNNGTFTLAAGAQQTIYSAWIYTQPGCGFSFTESLKVQYDSAGWSPYTTATATAPCG